MNTRLKQFGALLLFVSFSGLCSAVPQTFNGLMGFTGGVKLTGDSIETATGIESWVNTSVLSVSGSFSGLLPPGAPISFSWYGAFQATPYHPRDWNEMWSVGDFSFSPFRTHGVLANDSSIYFLSYGFLAYSEPTPLWGHRLTRLEMTILDGQIGGVYPFVGRITVPEHVGTLPLLGVGLVLCSLVARRIRT